MGVSGRAAGAAAPPAPTTIAWCAYCSSKLFLLLVRGEYILELGRDVSSLARLEDCPLPSFRGLSSGDLCPCWNDGGIMTGDKDPAFSALLMRLSVSIGDGVAPSTWKPTTLRGAPLRVGASMPCDVDVLDGSPAGMAYSRACKRGRRPQ